MMNATPMMGRSTKNAPTIRKINAAAAVNPKSPSEIRLSGPTLLTWMRRKL